MDVFFFVATIAVLIMCALVSLVVWRFLRILRNIEKLSETVSEETQLIKGDIDAMRTRVREEGFHWADMSKLVRSAVRRFITGKFRK